MAENNPPNTPALVSAGVFAHNDAATIGPLLARLRQPLSGAFQLGEGLVVSSGSTDGTNEAARRAIDGDTRFRLIVQDQREGKTAAVNLFLRQTRHDLCLLINADTLPAAGAVARLLAPFDNADVGMSGGHPVPVSETRGPVGEAVRLLWELHHRVALRQPKMGEMVAFRRVVNVLPLPEAAADEDWLHSEFAARGCRVEYVPEAIVFNRGPATWRELISQRRRNHSLHLGLIDRRGFWPATRSRTVLATAAVDYLIDHPWQAPALVALAIFEVACRACATWDYLVRRKAYVIWQILPSSKGISPTDVPAYTLE